MNKAEIEQVRAAALKSMDRGSLPERFSTFIVAEVEREEPRDVTEYLCRCMAYACAFAPAALLERAK